MSKDQKKPQNQRLWPYILLYLVIGAAIGLVSVLMTSCSPKVIYQKETVIEYRDTTIRDTAYFEVPVEVEKIVTRDTVSHLENSLAISDAMVTDGFLHHSLETKPQEIPVPVVIHVRDTIRQEAQIIEKEVEVEKPLSWWQKFRQGAFLPLLLAVVLLLLWTFRKLF